MCSTTSARTCMALEQRFHISIAINCRRDDRRPARLHHRPRRAGDDGRSGQGDCRAGARRGAAAAHRGRRAGYIEEDVEETVPERGEVHRARRGYGTCRPTARSRGRRVRRAAAGAAVGVAGAAAANAATSTATLLRNLQPGPAKPRRARCRCMASSPTMVHAGEPGEGGFAPQPNGDPNGNGEPRHRRRGRRGGRRNRRGA